MLKSDKSFWKSLKKGIIKVLYYIIEKVVKTVCFISYIAIYPIILIKKRSNKDNEEEILEIHENEKGKEVGLIEKTDSQMMTTILGKFEFVLVVVTADWCGNCDEVKKIINKDLIPLFSQDLFKVVELDIDKNKSMADTLGLKGTPALILFHNQKIMSFNTDNGNTKFLYGFEDYYIDLYKKVIKKD